MKVRKFVKHLDFTSNVRLIDEYCNVLFEGGMLELQTASLDNEEELHMTLNDARLDADEDFVTNVTKALPFVDYRLDTCADYEAVSAKVEKNKYGVDRLVFEISVKRGKKND